MRSVFLHFDDIRRCRPALQRLLELLDPVEVSRLVGVRVDVVVGVERPVGLNSLSEETGARRTAESGLDLLQIAEIA